MKKILLTILLLTFLVTLSSCSSLNDILSKTSQVIEETISSDTSADEDETTTTETEVEIATVENIEYDGIQFHFLELGNKWTGDSTYIKTGDTDILVDAGSRDSSSQTIKSYLDNYVTDGKLEYVIATHAHQDHIAGFAGTNYGKSGDGILQQYEVDTIIDFSLTNSTSSVYKAYVSIRDELVENGTTHYTASECWNEENGAQRSISITDDVTMDILYNDFYFETSSNENNYSVCTMFNYKEHHFLLTGDLEKEGEESLASYYDGSTSDKTLPHVELFKGGHHGSATSSNDCLLSLITPSICCVCCCAGCTEYSSYRTGTFPTQTFIDRISKYTDLVYVTTCYNDDEETYESLNGNIVVSSDGASIGVNCSNTNSVLKDTDWFNHLVYVDENDKIISKSSSGGQYVTCRTWNG